jgi:DNA-binding transcriptional regulator YiaG
MAAEEIRMTPRQLRTLRAKLGLDQWGLAERIGVDQATISRWEAGKVPISRVAVLLLKTMRHLA